MRATPPDTGKEEGKCKFCDPSAVWRSVERTSLADIVVYKVLPGASIVRLSPLTHRHAEDSICCPQHQKRELTGGAPVPYRLDNNVCSKQLPQHQKRELTGGAPVPYRLDNNVCSKQLQIVTDRGIQSKTLSDLTTTPEARIN
ncbi:hypothetical protein J6590_005202 [Homalodisca vitripennis]|nr:hypothetical protein J6590_005202 [Homalodisca vitripennis]